MKHHLIVITLASLACAQHAAAQLRVTEIHSTGSSNATYVADWFELTNFGSITLDITGWKIDDSSPAIANAVSLRGVTSIAPGQSVVFVEGNATGTNDATIATSFINAWFGGTAPAGFAIGGYGGTGVSLSSTNDAVNIFDTTNTIVAAVTFGAATTGVTFDNAAGLNNAAITTKSVSGTNGAFTSASGGEIGSPGAIPEPSTLVALVSGVAVLGFARRRA